MAEQRNRYRGSRPWLRLGFRAADGSVCHHDLVADTGSPAGLILRPDIMDLLRFYPYPDRNSNLGTLFGGWVRLYSRNSVSSSLLSHMGIRAGLRWPHEVTWISSGSSACLYYASVNTAGTPMTSGSDILLPKLPTSQP